jgi:hypothetical protein
VLPQNEKTAWSQAIQNPSQCLPLLHLVEICEDEIAAQNYLEGPARGASYQALGGLTQDAVLGSILHQSSDRACHGTATFTFTGVPTFGRTTEYMPHQ